MILNISLVAAKDSDTLLFRVGFFGGFGLNFHSADFAKLKGVPNCCQNFDGGSGSSIGGGLLFDLPINDLYTFNFNLRYSGLDGNLDIKNKPIGQTIVQDLAQGNQVRTVDVTVDHNLEAKIPAIFFNPNVFYSVTKKFEVGLGLSFAYLLSPSFSQKEVIIQPQTVTFLDGKYSRNEFNNQALPEANSFLVYPTLTTRYRLKVGSKFDLLPYASFNYGIMNVSTVSWAVSQLDLGIALAYNSYKSLPVIQKFDTIIRRDTITKEIAGLAKQEVIYINKSAKISKIENDEYALETTEITENYEKRLPKKTSLNFDFTVNGVNEKGEVQNVPTLIIEEMETAESFPLLPYTFFKDGNSDLKETETHLLNEKEIADFDLSKLKWNTLDIYKDVVNIIGYRMRQNSAINITITGCNANVGAEANNLTLSEARANAIANYLINSWKISKNRITIKKQNLPNSPGKSDDDRGASENRRVEIASNNFDLMKPVELREVTRKSNPPIIAIKPSGEAEAGEYDWTMTVAQNKKPLRNYNGKNETHQLNWSVIEEPIPQLETPIEFKLNVKDKYGYEQEVNKQLQIEQLTIKKKREVLKDDKIIEKYALIVFDFDQAKVNAIQKNILNGIKPKIKPNSIVTIAGYTDVLGNEEYNFELASRRTKEVANYLELPNAILQPIGAKELLYDNSTPQGRSYSRTVKITIETPLK